jgi:hypothetical protein
MDIGTFGHGFNPPGFAGRPSCRRWSECVARGQKKEPLMAGYFGTSTVCSFLTLPWVKSVAKRRIGLKELYALLPRLTMIRGARDPADRTLNITGRAL